MTITAAAEPSALTVFDGLLRQGSRGERALVTLHDPDGGTHRMDAAGWCRSELPGDRSLLARCEGPALDVGCGPGRLTSGLGSDALGIDVSAMAVRLTRARGASALRRDVFSVVPDPGRWQNVLLADGNVGIGGDPVRLLRRCRDLLAPTGRVQVELAAPGIASWAGPVRISTVSHRVSAPFDWAVVGVDAVTALAADCGMAVETVWEDAGRWFASLGTAGNR